MSMAQRERWRAVLDLVTGVLIPGPRRVVVTSDLGPPAAVFADRLVEALAAAGAVGITVARAAWPPAATGTDVVIALRERRGGPGLPADVVVDMSDSSWPVVRHIEESLSGPLSWHRAETQAFFAARATSWDTRFGDDRPAYARAVAELDPPVGGVAIDVGCGTGRALPALRDAVGPQGTVVGIDMTIEMLATCRELGRSAYADLLLADARGLPLRDSSVDAVFAAGLLGHLPDVDPVLGQLARVTRADGRLALFHPSGRAALAARHGRVLRDNEPLAESVLAAALNRSGWSLEHYHDPPDRFFARATRNG